MNLKENILRYLSKIKRLKIWKEEKRIKWREEGISEKEIIRRLKQHKVFFFKNIFLKR